MTPKCQEQAKNKRKFQNQYVYSQSVTDVIMTVVVVGVPPVSRAGLGSFRFCGEVGCTRCCV